MTTLVDSVAQRISGQVTALTGKIEGILALASLIAAGAMPQREVCAFVVPLATPGAIPTRRRTRSPSARP